MKNRCRFLATVIGITLPLSAAAMPFTEAVSVVMRFEGGHNPADPSRYGITQATLDRTDIGPATVGSLTRNQARRIYRALYWDRIRGDALPDGIDLAVFDMAVQHGPVTAIKALQGVAGVTPDGKVGESTLAAIQGRCGLLRDLHAERAMRYADSQRLPEYGHGWFKRLLAIHALALRACRDPAP